ncbi:MAG: PAS domain S-box protein [Methanomicrobiales archaeon]|nr:PAS domain S-box protein [Methanomicrobiales archaeon]
MVTGNRDGIEQIKNLLKDHPEGMSITDIVKVIPLNRNTASRYLDTLLVSGQVEMRHFGMAKLYSLSQRLPVSSVLSISSEYVMQLDRNFRIIFLNAPFLELLELTEQDVIKKKIDFTRIPVLFDEEYPRLLRWISEGLSGVERKGEIYLSTKAKILVCRVSPAVFADGKKGVSILFEDVTRQRAEEQQLIESEEKFRTLVEASTDGILVSDTEGKVIVWNNALSRITGIPPEEAIGTTLMEIMSRCLVPERRDRGRVEELTLQVKTAIRSGSSRFFHQMVEAEIQRPDGKRRIIQQSPFPIVTRGGTLLGSVIHDVTERHQMLSEIQAREERFRTLFNNAADMITVHGFAPEGMPGRFIEVNEVGCRRLGYTREEFIRLSPRDIIDPSCKDAMIRNAKILMEKGSAVFEMIHVAKDGRKIPVEIRSHIFEFHGEKLVIGQVRDLTGAKEAEAAIRETEERLQLALAGSDTGMWELDIPAMKGRIDAQAAQILGYRKEDIGTHKTDWDNLSHPDDVPLITGRLLDYLEGRTPLFESEHRMRHASGEWIWVSGRGKITRRSLEGSPLLISGTMQDITKRKQADDALHRSEARLMSLIKAIPVGIGLTIDRVITEANNRMVELTGYTRAELIGSSSRILYPSDEEFERVGTEKYAMIVRTGTGLIETRWKRKDGTLLDILLSSTPLDPDNPAAGLIFTALDISARKQSERAVQSSEMRYRRLLEQSFDAVVIHRDGIIIDANESAAHQIGFQDPGALLGRSIYDFVHPDSREMVRQRMAEAQNTVDQTLPLCRQTYLRRDGTPFEVEIMSTIFPDPEGPATQTVFRNITDRVAVEKTLERSEAMYRALAESAADMIFVVDPEGVLLYANASCAGCLGVSPADLAGRRQEEIFPLDIARAHISCIRKVLTTGQPVEHRESIPTPAGTIAMDSRLAPVRCDDGTITSVVGITRRVAEP